MNLPSPVRDLIPQTGKMGFNQTLIQITSDEGVSIAAIGTNHLFLDDRCQLSNIALIEYVNQLTAAVQGYNEKDSQNVHKGLFVGLQEAEFRQTVYSGDILTIKRLVADEVPPVTFVRGIVERDGENVAELITKIYEVRDFSGFNLIAEQPVFPGNNEMDLNRQPPAYLASKLRRKLYSYLRETQIGDGFVGFGIACPDDFDAFDGHFPGEPILPGIIILEIANLALDLFVKKPVVLKNIKKMKISGVVLPNQVITCNIKIDQRQGSLIGFSAFFKEGDREISRFSGSCVEGEAL
jgi:3-hydroxyacyl-[acyl-carrier-protein] dehydratase